MGRRADAAEALAAAVEKKDDSQAREKIAQLGAIRPLVATLQEVMRGGFTDAESNAAAEFAALALCRLARSKNLRNDICYSDGISALLGMLALETNTENNRNPNVGLTKNSMLALVNLATVEGNRMVMRKLGAITLLAPLIRLRGRNHKAEGDSVQELAVRLLATLCNCKDREVLLLPQRHLALPLGLGFRVLTCTLNPRTLKP